MNKFLLVIRPENKFEQNQAYIKAIEKFGGEAVLVRDEDSWDNVLEKLKDISGILLPGGDEVGNLDFLLIEYALINNIKLLGICQGMQSMALYGSNDSMMMIDDERHYLKDRYCHRVVLEKDSIIYSFCGRRTIDVNSYHRQTVLRSNRFSVMGRSDDGLIELIENKNSLFQIGVQWHPERMLDYDDVAYKLMEMFITI